jgi:hypothetical protein
VTNSVRVSAVAIPIAEQGVARALWRTDPQREKDDVDSLFEYYQKALLEATTRMKAIQDTRRPFGQLDAQSLFVLLVVSRVLWEQTFMRPPDSVIRVARFLLDQTSRSPDRVDAALGDGTPNSGVTKGKQSAENILAIEGNLFRSLYDEGIKLPQAANSGTSGSRCAVMKSLNVVLNTKLSINQISSVDPTGRLRNDVAQANKGCLDQELEIQANVTAQIQAQAREIDKALRSIEGKPAFDAVSKAHLDAVQRITRATGTR